MRFSILPTAMSVVLCMLVTGPVSAAVEEAEQRPNILWISIEDISPDLGCYGDTYAITPQIDRLAAQGVRFSRAFSHSGVCAPTRSGIITGMYPTTIGTQHMRCKGVPPPQVKCFTEYLRAAGYYCSNRWKTDYQFASPDTAWDESSRQAHWRGRKKGQPFFSVINLTSTHESQIRNRRDQNQQRVDALEPHLRHDPAKAVLPPYYPDTPKVRNDWASYADNITAMDGQVAHILQQLHDDGLADETIVWFWGDHGRGLPRGKRWIYDSGLQVPLIVRVPEKWRAHAMPSNPDALGPGTVNDSLVAFIDFAPTMLSLAGVPVPEHIQGQAFLGSQRAEPRRFIFAHRDRMDERYDLIRAVRDKRYKYIRNFMPHLSYGQDIAYMNEMPTMQEMRRLNAAGQLVGPQQGYFRKTKPIEELYDTAADPHEIHNLADDPAHADVLRRLRDRLVGWMEDTGDVGLIPEPEFDAMKRPGGEMEQAATPTVHIDSIAFGADSDVEDAKRTTVSLGCVTDGASIAYRMVSKDDAISPEQESKASWQLYSSPVSIPAGQRLRAKSCRLGFRDSVVVDFRPPGRSAKPLRLPFPQAGSLMHWRERLSHSTLLERLMAIKALDGRPAAAALPKYFAALDDDSASVRYWAVLGIHNNSNSEESKTRAQQSFAKLLDDDPAPIVRIATAHALCDWGDSPAAVSTLAEMLGHEQESVRLNAAIALGQIGEKARPVLRQIRESLKGSSRYVMRVGQYTLLHLNEQ